MEGGKVTVSFRRSGDDLQIVGMTDIKATAEFTVRSGRITYILYKPDSEDWARVEKLTGGGIGIEFGSETHGMRVKRFTSDSLAPDAGLQIGDVITAIDGVEYVDMRVGEARLRCQGPLGSKVRLTVTREGESAPVNLEVTRIALVP
jgi:C-terminal processing protease CtpA/Prc